MTNLHLCSLSGVYFSGNVRVLTRVHPSKKGEATVVHVEDDFVHVDYRGSEKPFLFDAVLEQETTQAEVHIQTHT